MSSVNGHQSRVSRLKLSFLQLLLFSLTSLELRLRSISLAPSLLDLLEAPQRTFTFMRLILCLLINFRLSVYIPK